MPSSLAVIHSSTLGFSPRPPVSVYGTGRHALGAAAIFLPVWLPALSRRPWTPCTVGARSRYPPSTSCSVRRRQCHSRVSSGLYGGLRNINRIAIRCPFRVPVRSRLTLIRLALFRNPWAFGARVSLARCRYSCLHFLFAPLQTASRLSFSADANAPLPIIFR